MAGVIALNITKGLKNFLHGSVVNCFPLNIIVNPFHKAELNTEQYSQNFAILDLFGGGKSH